MIYEEISTKSKKYKEILEQYNKIIAKYQDFEENLSIKNKIMNSGKAASYKRTMVRILDIYKQIYGNYPSNLRSSLFIEHIYGLLDDRKFKKFNREHHNFYSATINSFIKFLIFENKNLTLRTNYDQVIEDYEKDYLKRKPAKRENVYIQQLEKFPRNLMEKELAKKRANWKCEFDSAHKTFKLPNGKGYVEAHHLIPMSVQNHFENSVDFADNMVSLCPNCHRKIHLAEEKERIKMIKYFYEIRKDKYFKHGIKVSLSKVVDFYR